MKRTLLFAFILCTSVFSIKAQEITYSGTKSISSSNFPTVNSAYTASYTQCIYKSHELSMDTIYGLVYETTIGTVTGANEWEIYLGETTKSSYATYTQTGYYDNFVTIGKK